MPQALLLKLTETCRRQGVPFSVVDRRAMVSCPALRSRLSLDGPEREALRKLLFRDSGVVVAPTVEKRLALAVELLARRQQRTLIATESTELAEWWVREVRAALGLGAPQVALLRAASPESRVVVGRYGAILVQPPSVLRKDYGMVIFDGVSRVDALTLMKTIRAVGARYLLGMADSPTRSDGLESPLFLALGGVLHQIAESASDPAPRLGCRFDATAFDFPYQGRNQYQALVASLARDEARARLIAAHIEREARMGHPCLVLSERRDHLDHLATLLPADVSLETLSSNVRPSDRSRILARFDAGEVSVLFATGQFVTEGISTVRMRRLFLTFPFSYVRKLEPAMESLLHPAPGKTEVLVFDYDDHHVPTLHRAFEKRRAFLERLARRASEEAQRKAQMTLPLEVPPE
jgi:superfamily II DNA or RNA helicase